jgi:hypothetical protein
MPLLTVWTASITLGMILYISRSPLYVILIGHCPIQGSQGVYSSFVVQTLEVLDAILVSKPSVGLGVVGPLPTK